MEAYNYAALDDSMDYLYAFFEQDLARCVAENRELIPEGLEYLLAEDSLEDYVWIWLKARGPNSFYQYVMDGGYPEVESRQAYDYRVKEWAIDNPPHVTWFREDGSALPDLPTP
ncbi:hypothetical protein CPHO_00925 [Corynebacterium phocae]|uniref:Uncharacterized protein n=2 Tax=Corynebacterium phocae TaxID=161895 RepID=A0A1L7D605_9CORY|nr:hypothetical protein CPHO_00925 [Corynebacterium phocae]KAA8728568.1 hypothetical protein F4V58_00470 [Corynebacterium phocae]